MTFPTIEAAALHLGAHQSALVHQFKRLERDIGAKLYHRATPRQPMRPTPRGTVLIEELSRPGTRALAAAQPVDQGLPTAADGWRQPGTDARRGKRTGPGKGARKQGGG